MTGETIARGAGEFENWKRKGSAILRYAASRANRRRCAGLYGFYQQAIHAIGKASNGRGELTKAVHSISQAVRPASTLAVARNTIG